MRFLWGIESTNSEMGRARRQAIRDTYLSYYKNGMHPNKICPLSALLNQTNSQNDCRVAYAFVVGGNPRSGTDLIHCENKNRPTFVDPATIEDAEDDVIYVNVKDMGVLRKSLAWFQYVTSQLPKLQFDYYAKVDWDTIIFPEEFFHFVDNNLKPAPHNEMTYGRTPPIVLEEKECEKFPGDYEGQFYFVSPDVAASITASACQRSDLNYMHEQYAIPELLKMHPVGQVKIGTMKSMVKEVDTDVYYEVWRKFMMSNQNWNDIQKIISSFTYIIGKFGEQSGQFTQEVDRKRAYLVFSGVNVSRIVTYDSFPQFVTQDERWKIHLANPDDSLGFWKAPLLEHELSKCEDGDFIIYSDVGMWQHMRWMAHLIAKMAIQNFTVAVMQDEYPETMGTKGDVFHQYCGMDGKSKTSSLNQSQLRVLNDEYTYSSKMVVIRKSPGAHQLIKDWMDGVAVYSMLDDSKGTRKSFAKFSEHRHEESILSVLLKCKYQEPGKRLFAPDKIAESVAIFNI